ncbi:polysaccharide biosynthesis/export family protein [Candidatus Thiothrix sp. Deng01]|uniref:Polysaccharide biosynthesis/export family protein n=1 Tax=Candidatus Thiothrix phosphatis TaxID=3112415 RepID=A0ABU6D0Z9_9GAMM|nr:polysaccharide biosynthesis/export family protein [Candidatus Thiothrix sp. Deng01]MEB4592726.1 polysaccharide biosynthesis/export family protein [Candidatus Thiothrix sp. Deng01]
MKMMWKYLFTLLMVAALAACSGGAPTYSTLPAATVAASGGSLPTGTSGSDRIAPQDLLEIDVFKVPDLSKEVRVDDNGNITLALIGTVHAEGLSASQLERQIASRLEKDYMHNPQVNVLVKASTANTVTVSGAVKKPGVYPLAGDTTVTQAIALAEGLDHLAVKDNITLFRNNKPYTVRLEDINQGKMQDPIVMAGDKIQVHTSGLKEGMDNVRGFVAPFTFF